MKKSLQKKHTASFFVVHLVFCCVPSNRQNLKWICWTICIWAAVSVARILYKITSNSKSCPFFSQFKLFILKWLAYDSIIHWMEFNRNQQKFIHPTDLKWQREWKKKVVCVIRTDCGYVYFYGILLLVFLSASFTTIN